MADPLHELLLPHLKDDHSGPTSVTDEPLASDSTTRTYLERLSTLSLKTLTTTEDESLLYASQSNLRSLQALSKRSHGSITAASNHLSSLPELIQKVRSQSTQIKQDIQSVEEGSNDFATKYERTTQNEVLDRRKTAALLNRSMDRVGNILELPSLLSNTVNSSSSGGAGSGASGSSAVTSGAALTGYASALDIYAHVKRLEALYPNSALVNSVFEQSEEEIANMTSVLINTLQSPNLKLAVAMRTIGWLRRVAPELNADATVPGVTHNTSVSATTYGNEEGAMGSLFLLCRLTTLKRTLEALEPLKQLADGETEQRTHKKNDPTKENRGQGVQSERFLKRFIEIFREQSFAIVSMYKSIFPAALPVPGSSAKEASDQKPQGSSIPQKSAASEGNVLFAGQSPALAAFVPHLVDMLVQNLRIYLPNIADRSSRDSLLSQVLFCAGSLGRLGADFGMVLALIEEDLAESEGPEERGEWVEIMKKHRVQASRLEVLASGVATGRKSSMQIDSRPQSPLSTAK